MHCMNNQAKPVNMQEISIKRSIAKQLQKFFNILKRSVIIQKRIVMYAVCVCRMCNDHKIVIKAYKKLMKFLL